MISGERGTGPLNLSPQRPCSTILLLEAPGWEPAASFCPPVGETSAHTALKGPNPGKHRTRDFRFSAVLHCRSGGESTA